MLYSLAYPFALLLSVFFTLLSVVVAPFIAPLADEKGNLPKFLYWFQTFDDDLDAGVRAGFTSYKSQYMNRVAWLWRNPAYGFHYFLLGVSWDASEWTIRVYKNEPTYTIWFATGRGFNFYYQGPLGTVKLGWKAWNKFSVVNNAWRTDAWGPMKRVPLTFSLMFKQKI